MADAGRTPDAATPRAMLSARFPAPTNPRRNAASPFAPVAAAGCAGVGWGGAAIATGRGEGSGAARRLGVVRRKAVVTGLNSEL
jgi:hypothetical protein